MKHRLHLHHTLTGEFRTRQDAIDLFGGRVKDLAEAIGVTSQAISRWPEQLERYHIGRVAEAAYHHGLKRKLAKFMK